MTSISEAAKSPPTSKLAQKILIADDDPGIVRFLANRCVKMGFEVQTAANGLQAVMMAGRNHPDVLIVDINLPEVDGLSVVERLTRPDKEPIDVIVITASSYPETTARCESFGAYYVRKGVDLWEGVRSALIEIFPDMKPGIAEEGKSPPRVEWERPRVLVVDGDPSVGVFLSGRLGKCGVDTLFASDPVQGYRIARRAEPSVILLDYPMPSGGTQYLLSQLGSTVETNRIPIFVMSARPLDVATETILRREAYGQRGAIQFFTKSLDTEELFTALQKFCAFTHNPNPPEAFFNAPPHLDAPGH